MSQIRETLTFDDILLVPQYSEVSPSQVNTSISFAKNIKLKIPVISAAMDTVTEHKMAIAMAQAGGFGVIHKNLSLQDQVVEVQKVKKFESGMILNPITLSPETPVAQALQLMEKQSISGVPVTVEGRLVGILTHRDLRFEVCLDQPISNIMTKDNLITAKVGIDLEKAKMELQNHRIEKLPVVDEKGYLKGLITIKDIEKSQAYPHSAKDSHGRLIAATAVSTGSDTLNRVEALLDVGVDILVVDTAHGHSKAVLSLVEQIRQLIHKLKKEEVVLVAGNTVTPDGVSALVKAGADIVKVGVGPGSICTTRVISGVGVPQASAILECAKQAQLMGKTIIADGGIKYSGDITKALALGANAVMLGGLLAGTDESPGEFIFYQGRTYKVYRGMGSLEAMEKGSKERYQQSEVSSDKLVPEGIEAKVPYKGPTMGILHQLIGGLRAGMGYVGASSLQELQEKAEFVKMTPQSLRESHVHNVSITKDAPNYRQDE